MTPLLTFQSVSKSYEESQVLNDIDLNIDSSHFYTLLGPSGYGKTTILKLIVGFEQVDSGEIVYQGKTINHIPANKRKVNTVFQDYALFPHLNVFDNIAFGLKIKKLSKQVIKAKVQEALKLVKLTGFENRMVDGMSGGQNNVLQSPGL